MHEIDCIVINAQKPNIFIGISYDCCRDCLLLATQKCIIKSDKCGSSLKMILFYDDCTITGILSLSPGLMVTVRKGKQQGILLYTGVLSVSLSITVPTCYCIKNIVINPCADKKIQNSIAFLALTVKHMYYPFVLDLNVPIDCIGFTINECIFDVCRKKCDDPCRKADCDIVESIALVEAALSHILNAEGEKLQKVIATTDDIDKILCVNREVNKTIINATHLEHALYAKLEAIEEACPSSICGTSKEQNSQLVIENTIEYKEKELQTDISSTTSFMASKANEPQVVDGNLNIEEFNTNENLIDKDTDESVSKNAVNKFLKRFYSQSDDHKHLNE